MSQSGENDDLGFFRSIPHDVLKLFGLITLAGPEKIDDYIKDRCVKGQYRIDEFRGGKHFIDLAFWKELLWTQFHIHIGPGMTRVVDGNRWPQGLNRTVTLEMAKASGYKFISMDENQSFNLVTLLWMYCISTIRVAENWDWGWIQALVKGRSLQQAAITQIGAIFEDIFTLDHPLSREQTIQRLYADLKKKLDPNQQLAGITTDLRTDVALISQYNQLAALLGGTSVQTHSCEVIDDAGTPVDDSVAASSSSSGQEPSESSEPTGSTGMSLDTAEELSPKRKRVQDDEN